MLKGSSSAASATSAIYDDLYILENGAEDWESLGIMSEDNTIQKKISYFLCQKFIRKLSCHRRY